jgi:hypothetical protein
MKGLLFSVLILGFVLTAQGCAVYAPPYGYSPGYYGYTPYYGSAYIYRPYGYYGFRPHPYGWGGGGWGWRGRGGWR